MPCCLRGIAVYKLQGTVLCRKDSEKVGAVRGFAAKNKNCGAGMLGGFVYYRAYIHKMIKHQTANWQAVIYEEGKKRYGRR